MDTSEETIRKMARAIANLEKKLNRSQTGQSSLLMGDVIGEFMTLPYLRGFWPVSSVDENRNVYDIMGQGRTLSAFNTPQFAISNSNNGLPYVSFNGSTRYLARASEAGLNVTAHFTLGCWLKINAEANPSETGFFGKWNATGNQRSYGLIQNTAGSGISGAISSNGTAKFEVIADAQVGTWVFTVLRYFPSIQLDLIRNGVGTTTLTSVPASVFSSTAAFEVGRAVNAGTYSNCDWCFGFLAGGAVPATKLDRLFRISREFFGV